MIGTDDLVHVLRRLKLSGVLQTLDLRTRQAVEENLDQQEFLYRVLHDEIERRAHHRSGHVPLRRSA